MICIEVLLHYKYIENEYWHILSFGFEAATIGGVADWFAVKALFKEIPIPFVRNHTNIIVKNRAKLSSGIVDLVNNQWLSVAIIKEKISNIPIVTGFIKVLKEPENKDKAVDFVKKGIHLVAMNIDSPEATKTLQKVLKNKINTFDVSVPLGNWLLKLIERGEHDTLWELILNTSEKTIEKEETRNLLLQLVEEKIKGYKKETLSKGIMVKLGEVTGAIDNQSIVDKLLLSVNNLISEAKSDPNHQLRQKFDKKILGLVQNIKNGHSESVKTIDNLKEKILNIEDLESSIESILQNLKTTISNQLEDDNAPISTFLKEKINALLISLESDEALQEKISISIKETIDPLIEKYHHEIGNLVSTSLSKLNDEELVSQIESKVGNDLQYIRLNGAIVGGIVGLVIAFIRVKFLHI